MSSLYHILAITLRDVSNKIALLIKRQNLAVKSIYLLWCSFSQIDKDVLKRRRQNRHLVMIICCVCRSKFRSYCNMFNCMRVSMQNLHYYFVVGDHLFFLCRRSSNCSNMFAQQRKVSSECLVSSESLLQSFKWKASNSYLQHCFLTLLTWC